MKINIYSIQKKSTDEYSQLVDGFLKMSKKFATVNEIQIYSSSISKAALQTSEIAKKSYSDAFEPFLKNGFNIALDVLGSNVDSFGFAKFLQDKQEINFFIGGAFGFERDFLMKCDSMISLSNLTMPHKLAYTVLCEQIFRGLAINNNHPYHK